MACFALIFQPVIAQLIPIPSSGKFRIRLGTWCVFALCVLPVATTMAGAIPASNVRVKFVNNIFDFSSKLIILFCSWLYLSHTVAYSYVTGPCALGQFLNGSGCARCPAGSYSNVVPQLERTCAANCSAGALWLILKFSSFSTVIN